MWIIVCICLLTWYPHKDLFFLRIYWYVRCLLISRWVLGALAYACIYIYCIFMYMHLMKRHSLHHSRMILLFLHYSHKPTPVDTSSHRPRLTLHSLMSLVEQSKFTSEQAIFITNWHSFLQNKSNLCISRTRIQHSWEYSNGSMTCLSGPGVSPSMHPSWVTLTATSWIRSPTIRKSTPGPQTWCHGNQPKKTRENHGAKDGGFLHLRCGGFRSRGPFAYFQGRKC